MLVPGGGSCGTCVSGRFLHGTVDVNGSHRASDRNRRTSDRGVRSDWASRRLRRRERVVDVGVSDQRCDAGRQLNDRSRSGRLRLCHLSENALNRVHARNRADEAFESCR